MESGHFISPETLKAYQEAVFSIFTDKKIIKFKVGAISADIAEFMVTNELSSAALITAYNPYSKMLSRVENESAQAKLIAKLDSSQTQYIFGEGGDAAGKWESEPSVLALNIKLESAESLASLFQQNAFVWLSKDGLASLKLMLPVSGTT